MNVHMLLESVNTLIRMFGIRNADAKLVDAEVLVHMRQPGSDRALSMHLQPCGESVYKCHVGNDVAIVVNEIELPVAKVLLFAAQVVLLNESMSRGIVWPMFEYDGNSR